jgi:hypothetical protein
LISFPATALAANPTEVGLVDPGRGEWHLHDAATGDITPFFYGTPGDVPFMGDWDCDGDGTAGLYRQSDGFVYLRNSNDQGPGEIKFFFGNPDDVPLAGDFDGDGCDTVSIYRPSEQRFHIINKLGQNNGSLGAAEFSFIFGNPGDKPVVGDWDGDGIDEVGLHRESTGFFYWRNTLTFGNADGQFFFGDPGDRFVAGDWGTVDGIDTPAVFRPSDRTFYFRHSLTQGAADSQFTLTGAGSDWLPVAMARRNNVQFTINTMLPAQGLPFGPFTATGQAVDRGWVCPSGNTQDFGTVAIPFTGGAVFRADKVFTCQDGSGTFTLRVEATVITQPFSDVGTWMVVGGTGGYVNLGGAGELVGINPTPTSVLDIFTGAVGSTK